jgi:hypothetical protein
VSRSSKAGGSRNQDRFVGAPLLIVWRKSALCKRCHQRQRVCKKRTEPGGTIIHRVVSCAEPKGSNPRSSMLAFRLRQTSGEERSRGRIRDQRVGPALKRAERNRNGTDGCRIRFRQFFTSSLHPLGNCISRCCTFCRKTSYFKGGTLLFSSADDPGRNSRTMEFHLTCGRPSCTVWWSRKNRSAP